MPLPFLSLSFLPWILTILESPLIRPDIIIHDLQQRTEILTLRGAHKGKASGLCFSGENGDRFLSCGVDKTVKLWNAPMGLEDDTEVSSFFPSYDGISPAQF